MAKHGIRMTILDLGKMLVDENIIVGCVNFSTRSNPEPKNHFIDVPIDSVLIEVPDYGNILVDMGCDPLGMTEHWPESIKELSPYYQSEEQTMEHQLALCGLKPEDIRTVILSHMHVDHTGYLYLFPHAEVLVQRSEMGAAFTYAFEQYDQEGHTTYMRRDLLAPIDKYHIIEDRDYEVCPGVECIFLPGHTPGLMGVKVELDNGGTFLFPRDARYTWKGFGPPLTLPMILANVADYTNSIARIRDFQKNGATVILSHDAGQAQTTKHAPDFYD